MEVLGRPDRVAPPAGAVPPRTTAVSRGRRRLCLLPALAGLAALPGCAASGGAGAPPPSEIAPGVYLLPGVPGDVDAATLGRVGNAGFVVGDRGVLAVDTGTSFRHGERRVEAIRSATDRPLLRAVVTHVRQEFLFGAGAYRRHGAEMAMHSEAARLMAQRCETCLATLRRVLGEDEMRGTAMWQPDLRFDGSHDVDLGGRRVRVLHFGASSGPGDVAVLDLRTRVVFAGGLLDDRRIPDVQDGDLAGWRRALAALRALRPARIVPGHGAVGGPALIEPVERYLAQLEDRVRGLLDEGAGLSEVADRAALPAFAGWDQYGTVHRRNASSLFLRLERARFLEEPAAR